MSNKPFAFAVATICAMGLAAGLHAATITVTGGGTIATALAAAAAGDTIFIDKATHLEIGDSNIAILNINKNITIRGRGKDLSDVQCYFNIVGPQPGAPLPGYEFTSQADVDAWTGANSVTKSYVAGSDGGIRFDVTGGDPFCGAPARNLGNAPITCTFRVYSSLGGDFQIFWMGATGGISEGNSKHFSAPTGAWAIFTFDMPALGPTATFRFDGPGTNGYYILNYMRFEGKAIATGASNVTFQDITFDGGCAVSGGPRMGSNLINASNTAVTLTNVRLKNSGANGAIQAGGTLTATNTNAVTNVGSGYVLTNGTLNLTGCTAATNNVHGISLAPAGATSNLTANIATTTVSASTTGMAVNATGTAPASLNVTMTGCTLTNSKDYALLLNKWWGLNASLPGTYNINTTTFGNSNLGLANLVGGATINLTGCTIGDIGWGILNQGGTTNSIGTTWAGAGVGILNNGGTCTADAATRFQGNLTLQNGTTTINGSTFEGSANLNCLTAGTVVTLNKPVIKDCAVNNFLLLSGPASVTFNDMDIQGKCGALFAIMRSNGGILNINGASAASKLNLDPMFKNPADNTDRAIVFVRNAGGTINMKWLTASKIPATNEFVSGVNDAAAWAGPITVTYSKCAFRGGSGGFRAIADAPASTTPVVMTAGNTIWQGTGFPGTLLNLVSNSTVPSLMTIDNCTIYGGTTSNLISGNPARGDIVTAKYCIIDATGGLKGSSTIALSGEGNIVRPGTETDFSLGKPADTVIGDAMLDPATGYLTAASKLAFGKAINSTRGFDVNDNVRPQPAGTKPDIGGFEYNQPLALITGTYLDAALTVAEMAGKSIDVVVKQGATVVKSATYTLDAEAKFVVPDLVPGTYDVLAKSTHWLRGKVAGVVVDDVNVPISYAAVNGDADGDNQVNLFDFAALDTAFNTADAMADLNADGSVNLMDYVIIDTSFGAVGEAL